MEEGTACIRAAYARWGRETTVAQMRADWDALFGATVDAACTPAVVGGVACEWIAAPGARAEGAIVYLHGGGFQIGSIASHRELMARLSAAAGLRVLGVDFRLAPEHRHPAQLDDAVAVVRGLREQGFTPQQMALAGDSAGGGLALSVLLALQAQGEALPAAVATFSAWTDMAGTGASYADATVADPLYQPATLQAMARARLGKGGDPDDALASPARASDAQLAAWPPVLLQVGQHEIIRSDSEDLARRLRLAGVDAELEVEPGGFHVFQQFPQLPQAQAAVRRAGHFLAARVGSTADTSTRTST